MDGIDGKLIIQATAAAGLAKTAVDVIRTQTSLPTYAPPAGAFLFSLLILAAMIEASGTTISGRQEFASIFLGAFIATPLAIGATAVQSRVEQRTTERIVQRVQDERAAEVANITAAASASIAEPSASMLETIARNAARAVIDEAKRAA